MAIRAWAKKAKEKVTSLLTGTSVRGPVLRDFQPVATTVVLTRFTRRPDGQLEFIYTHNGVTLYGIRFTDEAEMDASLSTLLASPEDSIRTLIAYWLSRDANLSNPSIVQGKTLTINFGAANPIRLQ